MLYRAAAVVHAADRKLKPISPSATTLCNLLIPHRALSLTFWNPRAAVLHCMAEQLAYSCDRIRTINPISRLYVERFARPQSTCSRAAPRCMALHGILAGSCDRFTPTVLARVPQNRCYEVSNQRQPCCCSSVQVVMNIELPKA